MTERSVREHATLTVNYVEGEVTFSQMNDRRRRAIEQSAQLRRQSPQQLLRVTMHPQLARKAENFLNMPSRYARGPAIRILGPLHSPVGTSLCR